jgi:hypothetical protein
VLTVGTFVTFIFTENILVLIIALFWPLVFPAFYAMGLAVQEKLAPLMIEKMVKEWEADLLETPEERYTLGDRVVVWVGRKRNRVPVPAVVLSSDVDSYHRQDVHGPNPDLRRRRRDVAGAFR